MEFITLFISLGIVITLLAVQFIETRRLHRFKSSLRTGTILRNTCMKLFDPYYKEGFDTCAVLRVSDDYVLVRFNDKNQTEMSVPVSYLYGNCWEKDEPDSRPVAKSDDFTYNLSK